MSSISIDDIITAILTGRLDEDLDDIERRIQHRKKDLSREQLLELSPGDIVEFHGQARPKYLHGLRAEVIEPKQSRVHVRIIPEDRAKARRFGHGTVIAYPAHLRPAT